MAQLAAKKYATALFELAVERGKVDEYTQTASYVMNILSRNVEFDALIKNPRLTSDEKMELVKNVFKTLPDDFFGLIALIFNKKRGAELSKILEGFVALSKEHKGILEVEVTSAVALTERQLEKTRAILSQKLKKHIVINATVDKTVIAGLRIKAGGLLYDATVASRLRDMERQLLVGNNKGVATQ